PMQDPQYGGAPWIDPYPPPRRRSGRRWLLIGGLAAAFALALGVGALLGSSYFGTAQAAGVSSGNASYSQGYFANAPGAQGQCEMLTVSSVSGQTITAKTASGSTVTIHVTSSTKFTHAGAASSLGAVTAGATISVMGTHNSDGSITATQIDIR
ncbi:MAG TPA: DUF5666 domain-containing protein, partial [Ktedonobacterales bacterium]|nr:DUF5666 domain-containing protein [Ktedonobacterales bacterium]